MYPAINAGAYDQKISIRQRPITKSVSGEDIEGSPVDVATLLSASVRVAGGQRSEFFTADRLLTKTHYQVETYYLNGIAVDETMEIYWHERDVTLDILQVQDLGIRPRNLVMIAEERR